MRIQFAIEHGEFMNTLQNKILSRRRRTSRRRGLSLIELLISLTIAAALLVAVGVAYKASADAIGANDSFFRASQAGRVCMNQILTELRRADSVQVTATTIDVIRPAGNRSPNEVHRLFTYDAVNKRVTVQIFYTGVIAPSPVRTLVSNLGSGSGFGPAEMGPDYSGSTYGNVAVRIPVTLVITAGKNFVVLSGAAAPRRASRY
jgi:prepilin-type N-terminal cleavage/methylation domain-containing protein